jgi:hypothetical protein
MQKVMREDGTVISIPDDAYAWMQEWLDFMGRRITKLEGALNEMAEHRAYLGIALTHSATLTGSLTFNVRLDVLRAGIATAMVRMAETYANAMGKQPDE